jgi:hypothetical protein
LELSCVSAGPTLIGILPYAGLKFYIYEELKRHVPEEHQNSVRMHLPCGALAGLFGQTITYPLDVVRRQMQVKKTNKPETRFKLCTISELRTYWAFRVTTGRESATYDE